jgi:hypothetical protein
MKLFTPSKKFTLLLAVVVVGSLLGVTIAIACGEPQESEQKATEQEAQEGNESGYKVVNGYTDLYERSYARATTDEQREQLKAIFYGQRYRFSRRMGQACAYNAGRPAGRYA